MPVRQQYFIAAAVIGLIAVMVLFAIFDYTSDRSRFAQQMAVQPQGPATLAAVVPSPVSVNPNDRSSYGCPGCGWRGICPANGLCPNCFGLLSNWATGTSSITGQNAAIGIRQCFGCGWRGMCPTNRLCPNCRTFLGNPGGTGPPAATGQNAGFWSFQQSQPQAPVRPRGMLYCPSCAFAMSSRHSVTPNAIQCPRCPAYLVRWDQSATGDIGNTGLGQQAGFVRGTGQGLGQGLNPYCPVR